VSTDDALLQETLPSDSIARNALFATLTTALTAVFVAVLTLYLIRALSPDGYGKYTLALAVGGLFALPMDLGINSSLSRFIAEHRGERGLIAEMIGNALSLKLLVAGGIGLATFVSAGWIADLYHDPGLTWPLRGIAIALTAFSLTQLFGAARVAQGRIASGFAIPLTQSGGVLVASVALVSLGAGATGAAFGRAAGYTVALAVGAYLTARLFGGAALRIDPRRGRHLRLIAGYAGVLAIVEGAYAFFDQLDVLLIGAFLDERSVGLFQAAVALTVFMHYPSGVVSTSVAPRIARQAAGGGGDVGSLRLAARLLTIGYGALLAPLVVWAKPIVDLALGSDYSGSVEVLRAIAPYVFISGVGGIFSFAANYLGQARRRLPVALAAVAINVILDVILIPRIGIVAGAIGTDVAIAVYVPAHVLICSRVVDVRLGALVATTVRTLLAACAMGGVLWLIGTEHLSPRDWALGTTGGVAAYVVVLLLTRELSTAEVQTGLAWMARLRR